MGPNFKIGKSILSRTEKVFQCVPFMQPFCLTLEVFVEFFFSVINWKKEQDKENIT